MPIIDAAERDPGWSPRQVSRHAERQGGAISHEQLRKYGLSPQLIHRLYRKGWLRRQHTGVYRIGRLSRLGILFAAHLAMGTASVISHRSAGHWHGYLRGRWPADVDVTCAGFRRPRRGIKPHEAKLAPEDIVVRNGLRLTSPSRTLLDLAAIVSLKILEAAVDEARIKGDLRLRLIEECIARCPGHHGIGKLRAAVARHDPGKGRTRSELERRARKFLRDRDYPPYDWQMNIVMDDGEVFCMDAVWGGQQVILELDGRSVHDNDPTYHADRRKNRRLGAVGWEVVRATWEDFDFYEDELDQDLRAVLNL